MNSDKFQEIEKAIALLQMNKELKRLDGTGWAVYRLSPKMIRVDIKDEP